MATNRDFNDMLNEHLNYDLLKNEFMKRDYILSKVQRDDKWRGGDLPVPFKGQSASSIRFGQLTAQSDVSKTKLVRGTISNQPEVWGTLRFEHKDIMQHDGAVKEQSFLKALPDSIEDFVMDMKNAVSHHILAGLSVATLTGDGQVGGTCTVDRIERFEIDQKLQIDDDDTAAVDVYVTAINLNTDTLTVSATRGGAALDISAYTTAQNAKLYLDGAQANGMTSLRSSLLSLANGGSANLYGQSKLAYPYLQAIQVDGSGVTAANIAEKIFDGFTDVSRKGKGKPDTVLMSWKNLGSIMKDVENDKGPYKVAPGSMKASLYGWTEIEIFGVKGRLTVVGIHEMDDDIIIYLDWRAIKFHSNNFFQKRIAPDGKQYYEVREETGYFYLLDVALMGDLVLSRPQYCGIMHSISY